MFYVYVLSYPNGIPFYVGKGTGDRLKRHDGKSHSEFVNKIVAKIKRSGEQYNCEIVFESGIEQLALDHERILIRRYGRRINGSGTLANLTEGGLGQAGRVVSQATREKLSQKGKFRIISDDHKEKLSKFFTGFKHSAETKAKVSKAAIERATPEYREEQSLRTSRQWTAERRQKQSERIKAKWANPEFRQSVSTKNSLAAKRQWNDPVMRNRVVVARNSVR